jgi:hypothetical protein
MDYLIRIVPEVIMLDPLQAKTTLHKLFRKTPIVELGALFEALQTSSRMSVFRRMKEVGYFSSYTHAGRFYTLRDIPQFDASGLWHHGDVSFSRAGTLKATVVAAVGQSPAGRTHNELKELLHVRAFNTLLELVRAEKIRREVLSSRCALYISADKTRALEQIEHRRKIGAATTASTLVIEVLLELLRGVAVPEEVAQRLSVRGLNITVEQVCAVFAQYKLGEKKGARSPRLRH